MNKTDRTGKKKKKTEWTEPRKGQTEKKDRPTSKMNKKDKLDLTYRRRPRVVGVTDAVGDEEFEDKESWGEAEPNDMIEVGFGESVTDRSLFSSSLLLRETGTHKQNKTSDQFSVSNTTSR